MTFLLIVKLITLASCAGLKLWGELSNHNMQRWVMPAVLGLSVSLITGVWWLGILVYPCCIPIDFGYKVYGPSDGFDRGMWLFAILVILGLPLVLLHHLSVWLYVPWCILGGIWGATTRNMLNILIAPLTGLLIGIIVFLVR